MPHKCTKCGKIYEDGSDQVLRGCQCGNRLFLFIRKITAKEADELMEKHEAVEAPKQNKKFRDIIKEAEEGKKKRIEKEKEDKEKSTDASDEISNIKVDDGVYEIDIDALMSKQPIIVSGEEGRYLLSLSSAFSDKRGKKYTDLVKKK